jgi:hypothetical protein
MKAATRLLIGLVIVFAVIGGAGYQCFRATSALRLAVIDTTLKPIATLLIEDEALIAELGKEPFSESGNGVLESYLLKIRRDGVPRHADMKQRLDQLAENNTAIVTLIKSYAPLAVAPTFVVEGDRFRNYASAWRDRWNSVMELFMAGGSYAAADVPFPEAFPSAVAAEMAVAKP